MRSSEDKCCLNHIPKQEILSSNNVNFEFFKGNGANRTPNLRTALGKPTPSKWDDAQKWLVNLSRGGEKNQSKTKPRNSNADDRRLIAPVSKEENYLSDENHEEGNLHPGSGSTGQIKVETKRVECDESIWRINKASENSTSAVRSISVRDMGTEMTPIASQEPSRTATPIRATTPATRSPISSGSSTPMRLKNGVQPIGTSNQTGNQHRDEGNRGNGVTIRRFNQNGQESNARNTSENNSSNQARKMENRAMAWDEAKYMARYKREEVKIQAWENHEKRKAEMEVRKIEVRAERLQSRAQERYANKLAATRRIAEEKRANAETKLNKKALKTSERADYIRRTGNLPTSFSFKLPSCCW